MNFTHDQIAAIIGTKELELISLRLEFSAKWNDLEAIRKRLKELEDGLSANADAGGATVTPIKS